MFSQQQLTQPAQLAEPSPATSATSASPAAQPAQSAQLAQPSKHIHIPLLFIQVLIAFTCFWYDTVFTWYHLKPMQLSTKHVHEAFKSVFFAIGKRVQDNRIAQAFSSMRLCAKDKRKPLGTRTWIHAPRRPSDKGNGLHAPTQLRLSRTTRAT